MEGSILSKTLLQSSISDNLHIKDLCECQKKKKIAMLAHLDFSLYLYLHDTPRFFPLIRTWWVPESLIQNKAAKKRKTHMSYQFGKNDAKPDIRSKNLEGPTQNVSGRTSSLKNERLVCESRNRLGVLLKGYTRQ